MMHGYDREQIRRTTPIYGDLRAARYGDPVDEGYVPLSPTHPLARRLRALAPPSASRYDAALRRYGSDDFAGRPVRSPAFGRDQRPRYDAAFRPLRPSDPLARALRAEAEELVTDYLHEERYGGDYARRFGLRTRGRGDRLRDIARRISRGGYGGGW
jgi:hypothetical protein